MDELTEMAHQLVENKFALSPEPKEQEPNPNPNAAVSPEVRKFREELLR